MLNELVIDAKIENLDQVLSFVDSFLVSLDCAPKAMMQIDVAVEELFVNIASYAYQPDTGTAVIRIDAQDQPRGVIITFRDRGVPYDPLAKQDPDVTLSAEERKIGGLGIFMVKKSMDRMEYEYRDGQNILTVYKNI